MKPHTAIILGLLALLNTTYGFDFAYTYANVFEPHTDDYIVATTNIQRGADSVSYWHPIASGVPATLTQKFTFTLPTSEVFIHTELASYDFGGGSVGSGSFWISPNGIDWTLLLDAPAPSGGAVDAYYTYSASVPAQFTRTTELYTQTRLQTSGSNIMAQWSRQFDNTAFSLNANVVPEPATALFGLALAAVAATGRRRAPRPKTP